MTAPRSGRENDLPADVAARQPPVGVPDLAERVRRGDRQLQLAVRDQPGQLGQRARAGAAALPSALTPYSATASNLTMVSIPIPAMALMRLSSLRFTSTSSRRLTSTEGVNFAALETDLLLKGSDRILQRFLAPSRRWHKPSMINTFKSGPTDALAIGTGAAAPSGRAGEAIPPDCGVTATTLLATYKPAQQVA